MITAVRELSRQLQRVPAERRDAAAGVDQHRETLGVGEREDLPRARIVERELPRRADEA